MKKKMCLFIHAFFDLSALIGDKAIKIANKMKPLCSSCVVHSTKSSEEEECKSQILS